jgi:hypothetical protein
MVGLEALQTVTVSYIMAPTLVLSTPTLVLSTLMAALAAPPRSVLSFGAPTNLPHGGPWFDAIYGMADDHHAFGMVPGGFWSTSDGGASGQQPFGTGLHGSGGAAATEAVGLGYNQPWQNDTWNAVADASASAMHNLANITEEAPMAVNSSTVCS